MSSANLSIADVKFRRRGDDECDIVVYGTTVGTVMKRPDIANPDGGHYFAVHLYNDERGPALVDDRDRVKAAAASMIAGRDLVPWMPPPVHPDFDRHRHA